MPINLTLIINTMIVVIHHKPILAEFININKINYTFYNFQPNKILEIGGLPGKGGLGSLRKKQAFIHRREAFHFPKTHQCGLGTLRIMLLPNMLLLNVGGVGIEP